MEPLYVCVLPRVSNVDKSLMIECICSQSKLNNKNGLIPHGLFALWFVVHLWLMSYWFVRTAGTIFGFWIMFQWVNVNQRPGGSLRKEECKSKRHLKCENSLHRHNKLFVLKPSISCAHSTVIYILLYL